jgi:hypothetical protein
MEAEMEKCVYDTARLRIIGLGEKEYVAVSSHIAALGLTPMAFYF